MIVKVDYGWMYICILVSIMIDIYMIVMITFLMDVYAYLYRL